MKLPAKQNTQKITAFTNFRPRSRYQTLNKYKIVMAIQVITLENKRSGREKKAEKRRTLSCPSATLSRERVGETRLESAR